MTLGKQTRRKEQRGIAMIMALLALLLLAVIGTAFMFMNTSETSANGNYKDSQKAYFASRAGIENVRALLWSNAGLKASASSLQMPNPAGTGMIYVLNPAFAGEGIDPRAPVSPPVSPWVDDELCHEQFVALVKAGLTPAAAGAPCGTGATTEVMPAGSTYYTTTTLTQADTGTANPLPFKWVRITNKQNLMGFLPPGPTGAAQKVDYTQPLDSAQVCLGLNGQERAVAAGCNAWSLANLTDQVTPVWMLTSLALTSPGGSRRMTQMEVAYLPPLFPPGTISAEAPVTLVGSYTIQSDDYCTCTCTKNANTGITTCVNKVTGIACVASADAIFTAGTISQNGNSGVVVSTLGTTIFTASAQNQPWPYNIPQLINTYKQSAQNAATSSPWNYSCTGTPNFSSMPAVFANCGTQTNQQFGNFPPNLLTTGDESGAQPVAVYVPGSVSLHANNTSGAGVLIVDGDLQIDGGLTFYGLLLVRGKVSFTGGGSAGSGVNIFGALLAGEDVSATNQAMSDTFGGHISFTYDTCALRQAGPPGPPKLLATHELMY